LIRVAERRRRNHAGNRPAFAHQRDVDGVLGQTGEELAGAVERVDQQEPFTWLRLWPFGSRLLGDDRHAGQNLPQAVEDHGLGRRVGGGHRRAVSLFRCVAVGAAIARMAAAARAATRVNSSSRAASASFATRSLFLIPGTCVYHASPLDPESP
jgi:hypothetical protein